MTVVSLTEVAKSFRGVPVLQSVSLRIEEGETYGLVGPNGAGKSVLLKLLCRLMVPDTGEVWINPRFLDAGRTFPDRFGVTINGPAFLPALTGRDNLLRLAGIRNRTDAAEIDRLLGSVGLDPRSAVKARAFSTGMKQKLALAQAFMEEPEVLLLDEPFNGLDEASVRDITAILRDLKAAGKTIVFTSHDADHIAELSDTVLRVDAGRVAVDRG